jgi:hypothetical protein
MNMLEWLKSDLTGTLYGSTKADLEEDNLATYEIRNTTLSYNDNNICVKIRCASLDDAKLVAEIIERGRVAE